MAYEMFIDNGGIVNENATTATTAITLNTTPAAVVASWCAHMPFIVQRVSFKVSTAVNNLTGAVVTANVISGVQNSTPVTTAICTMTIPNGATAGSVYYNNNFTPAFVAVGNKLAFSIAPGNVGGTPVGAGYLGFFGSYSSEMLTNETATTVISVKT